MTKWEADKLREYVRVVGHIRSLDKQAQDLLDSLNESSVPEGDYAVDGVLVCVTKRYDEDEDIETRTIQVIGPVQVVTFEREETS